MYLSLSIPCATVVGANVVLTLIFGMFATCMIMDQFVAVQSSLSIIDRKQGNSFKEKSLVSGLIAVFGSPPGLSWLIPTVKRKKFVIEKEYKALVAKSSESDQK
eukprot:TRINITY_DN4890_c0_g1_i5.p2 TRINITY_DN4890_c0_g1~~TRINITY_DN4890_c0_g1_i5.p2  ORF type:complete len:104 (-),score=31.76 TRINITY_DN4890_c0_g1_i5:56-367(-)